MASTQQLDLEINNSNKEDETQDKKKCHFTKTALLIVVVILTSWFFVVEIVAGYLTKSNALIADSFHMLSDIISLIIGLISLRFSKRESSKTNTFGWARAEVVGSLTNAVFLLALCFTILFDSISRFLKPEPLEKIDLLIGVGGGGFFLNLISLSLFGIKLFTCNGSEKKDMNMNLHSALLNTLSDSLSSFAVIISGLLIKYAPPKSDINAKWKLYIDPTLSLMIACIIICGTIPLLKKSICILLQGIPLNCNIDKIKNDILSINSVSSLHNFHVWSLNSEKNIASIHVRLCNEQVENKYFEIIDMIKRLLHSNNIHMATIQLERDELCEDENQETLIV